MSKISRPVFDRVKKKNIADEDKMRPRDVFVLFAQAFIFP